MAPFYCQKMKWLILYFKIMTREYRSRSLGHLPFQSNQLRLYRIAEAMLFRKLQEMSWIEIELMEIYTVHV